ncbi:unnamed protein product [Lepeophtheirus salmonis]|uniref:RNA-directed DNA polymerase n=1 Tax=Lepeophtheirus salmonis TaxID=72036 RepID=A0A817FEX6_LEPSM|nr:unnamed protein product [Lepeophtheirus salmonis]
MSRNLSVSLRTLLCPLTGPVYDTSLSKRFAFSLRNGLLFWGIRLVIPFFICAKFLDDLYLSHRGVLKMKVVNRTKIWWPGMDGEISTFVTVCITCKTTASSPLALFKSKSRPSKGSTC